MTEQDRLAMLKVDLGISTSAFDERLKQHLANAKTQIEREGANLDLEDIGDNSIIVMYAAWLWRRRDSMEGMPRMLRYALNNRVFAEKTNGGESDG